MVADKTNDFVLAIGVRDGGGLEIPLRFGQLAFPGKIRAGAFS